MGTVTCYYVKGKFIDDVSGYHLLGMDFAS
jgi:hypothetical protein